MLLTSVNLKVRFSQFGAVTSAFKKKVKCLCKTVNKFCRLNISDDTMS